jgi:hypothetical protein
MSTKIGMSLILLDTIKAAKDRGQNILWINFELPKEESIKRWLKR